MNYEGAEGLEFGTGDTKVDPAVAARCKVVAIERHGLSFWAMSGRIDVELADGTPRSFFMKVVSKERGQAMMKGEFESMTAIHNVVPDFVPKPMAWGTYESVPDTHFFLCEFREMTEELPDVHQFTACLAALHKTSTSPTGKFGFHVTTYNGNLSQNNEWCDNWEEYFTKGMRHALAHEIAAQGPSEEIDRMTPIIFDRVIPRLLRPLESEGRSVKPSLVHGDLWYANTGTDTNTNGSLVFDACCFYGHNEYELGQWAPVCNRFGREYVEAYHSHIRISPPAEDYQGRIDLYKL
ncbi:hypothetical protein N7462_005501 [Penicillium macrosclerotiorum]|uniref:uncharacterized protein n=1 Tax=Penicillium macrosclerotiorum TaxID=303699 RepID=UPI0025496468|nr:uncharacterized protein N7462_005501 [Penicillium macrosclerotiorum]KAJ5682336.1 hypothetical protein N7462_005501 [Penicillium macrosclerotiorum]